MDNQKQEESNKRKINVPQIIGGVICLVLGVVLLIVSFQEITAFGEESVKMISWGFRVAAGACLVSAIGMFISAFFSKEEKIMRESIKEHNEELMNKEIHFGKKSEEDKKD